MFKLSDRIRETSLTSGSGDININDTFGGFQSFASGVGSGNQTYYAIENGINFEIGLGTYTSSNTITRDVVFDSSDPSGNKINLDGGASVVFCTYPATHSVFLDKNGMMSGQLPYYSGIAFPNGLLQTRAFIGSGNTGNVSYWSDENTVGGDDKFIWSDTSSQLFIDGDVSVSGNIINPTSTGDITFISSEGKSLLHAYVNDGNNNIIALHANDATSATWTLGLKPYSQNFADPPSHGYVLGNTSKFSCVINDQNSYLMNYSNGFWVSHRGVDLFNVDRNNGVNIYNNSPVEVPLTVNAAASQASNLQEWKSYTGSLISSLSKDGQMEVNSVKFSDGTIQTSVGVGIVTSGIIGSGTTNFIPKFSDTDTLTNSVISESGGKIGIGTDSPAPAGGDTSLHIAATNYPELKLTNDTTGHGVSNGTAIQVVNNSFVVTNRQNNGSITFNAFDSVGVSKQRWNLSPGGSIFNEDGENVDFRVEGNSDPNLLFLDASTDSIGIATDIPGNNKFRIHHNTARYNSENTAHIKIQNSGSTIGGLIGADATDDIFYIQAVDPGTSWAKNISMQAMGGSVGIGTINPGVYKLRVVGGHTSFEGGNVKFDGGNVTVNQDGGNYDFRVEGNSDENLLFADASTDRIGLGTNTPLTKLHIHAKTSEGTILSQTDLTTSFAGFLVRNQDNVNVFSAQYCNSGVNQPGLRNIILIGGRESGVPVKFYQGKETTNITGAAGAFEPNNERIIFDVDGNTTLTAASGQNVAVSGGNDFVVYGTGTHPLIYTDPDSGTGRVGIGRIPDNYVLDVSGSARISPLPTATHFLTVNGTTSNELFSVKSSEAVFNGDGGNYDFRIEGDTNSYLLHVDAGMDNVSIGKYSSYPNFALTVYRNTDLDDVGHLNSARGIYSDINHHAHTPGDIHKYSIGNSIDIRQDLASGVVNSGYVMGMDANGLMTGSGYLHQAYGLRTYAGGHTNFPTTGRIKDSFGVYNRVLNLGSGTMENAYGEYITISAGSNGTIGNAYGIYIVDNAGTIASGDYGIYQQGASACNYFAGSVGIGTDTTSQKLDINSSGIRIRDDHTPASASAAGNKGEIVWDSNYVYVCVATNTWKRSALSTW